MGGGAWDTASFESYACSTGRGYDASTKTYAVNYSSSTQAYREFKLNEALNPKNVVRECCDSNEHPNSFPIILALDVTGSMGDTAIKVQKQLNPIMEDIYRNVEDAEIAVMAIGDLAYDDAPIQFSQFESDIRIAENLDKIYFEGGGGGNAYESYTAAWYMGLKHTKLDCWKRGKKGLIITMGDEPINPYLPRRALNKAAGDSNQIDVSTANLYEEVSKKYDIYHICIESVGYPDQSAAKASFACVIGAQNVFVSGVGEVHKTIMNIVKDAGTKPRTIVEIGKTKFNDKGEICW